MLASLPEWMASARKSRADAIDLSGGVAIVTAEIQTT
jgi:hypothetical protein